MPVMDGLQATNYLRALTPPKRDIPIIGLTTDTLPGDEERQRGDGMDGYLSKPLSARAMFETMSTLLAGGRQRVSMADRLPAVDNAVIEALRDFLGPDQLEALLTETLADIGARITRLGDCLVAANTLGAAQEAHDLVSVSGNYGAAALSAIAREVEHSCRQGVLSEANRDFARMPRIAAEAVVALTAVRDGLAKN
jgi:two-component system, sensor histidine kinase and response regulator